MATHTISKIELPNGDICNIKDTNTTYTFTEGVNQFTVTPSNGTAQIVSVIPSITNNITGSGTSGNLVAFNGTNTITNGPQLGNSTTTFLRNDATWAEPDYVPWTLGGVTLKKNPSSSEGWVWYYEEA